MEKGFVIYRGPSVLDGSEIVAILTRKTTNAKTGQMAQLWIIRADMHPVEASKTGDDISVCGACPHRWHLGGACYVNLGQAPGQVYRAFLRGLYPEFSPEDHAHQVAGLSLRLGAYGDPAAVPFDVIARLLSVMKPKTQTGYTHQVAHKNFDPRLLDVCMVSADTPKQAQKFQGKGARTFRVKTPEAPFLPGEIECLADSKGMQCADCGLCDGKGDAPSIAITVHGSRATRYKTKFDNANLIAIG